MKHIDIKKRVFLLFLAVFGLDGCVNKHGVSLHYYSDCKEYYDLQGYYHKECGDDDIVTYKGVKEGTKKLFRKEEQDPNLIEGKPDPSY